MAAKTSKHKINFVGSKTLSRYLLEINEEEILSESDEIALSKKIHKGDQEAAEKLIRCNLRFVVSIAKQYNGRGLSLEDLINEGNIGLIKGVYKFDGSRGIKFISYAVWWIRQAISQALNECSRVVRLPLNKVNNLTSFVIARNALYQIHRRDPTLHELAAKLGITMNELIAIVDTYKFPLYADSAPKDDDNYSFVDILADENDTSLTEKKDSIAFNKVINQILSKLTDVESEVVKRFFGFPPFKPNTLDEIGDILNLTRERVRQIKEKAILNIKKSPDCDKLRAYLSKNFPVDS